MSDLPAKPLKRMLKRHHPEQVSDDAVFALRQTVEELIDEVGRQAEIEFVELNNRRKAQGLRELKRLDEWAIRRATQKVFSDTRDIEMGLQTASPGGER